MKTGKYKLAVIVTIVLVAGICIIAFGVRYFSQKEFYFDGHKYRAAGGEQQVIHYASDTGRPFSVQIKGSDRTVVLDGLNYVVSMEDRPYEVSYLVKYPNEQTYRIIDQGVLIAFDEHGQWLPAGIAIHANQGKLTVEGGQKHDPTELVVAAYPQYHQTRGIPALYVVSWLLFVFGWCSFRYESFQSVLFWASLRWIWTENPEPSEFYFFMSKIGGILIMLAAFVLLLLSLFSDSVLLPL